MQKKGMGDQVVVYAVGFIVVFGIMVVGYKMVTATTSKSCEAEIADFQLEFEGIAQTRNGITQKHELRIPCESDKMIIVDSITPPEASVFNEYPFVKDSLGSKTGKDIFLLKKKKIVESFQIPFLMVDGPYALCAVPFSGKVPILAQGIGKGVILEVSDPKQDCIGEFIP